MNPVARKMSDEAQKLVDEYLNKGGEVTECEAFAITEDIEYTGGFYQRRKKKKEAEENKDK